VPEDRGELVLLMEPLLVGEDSRFRSRLTDLALELAQKAADQPETARQIGSEMGVDLRRSGRRSRRAYLAQRRRGAEEEGQHREKKP